MKNRLGYNEFGAKNEMQRQTAFQGNKMPKTGSFWEKNDKIGTGAQELVNRWRGWQRAVSILVYGCDQKENKMQSDAVV